MEKDSKLPESDFRNLVRLMGRAISVHGGINEKRRVLLDGLLTQTKSQQWIWQFLQLDQSKISVLSSSPDLTFPLMGGYLPEGNPSAVQLLPNCIIGHRDFSTGETGRIALLRESSECPYGEREVLTIRMVLEEVPWLYRPEWVRGNTREDCFSNRQRSVLVHLSQGRGRNVIAGMMGISVHTVSDYIKFLFSAYGVHSQAELMNLFYKGTITIKQ